MATTRAIHAVCDAVVALLRDSYVPSDFPDHQLEFMVAGSVDESVQAGVTFYLYRIHVSQAERLPAGGRRVDDSPARSQLPLELHFLLTPWGADPSLRHLIAGWLMRTLDDHPILPAGVLNENHADVFSPEETVQLATGQIDTGPLLDLWNPFGNHRYQLSVPYVARNIRL